MSAFVVLSCERGSAYGVCPEQVMVSGAATVAEARAAAARAGWHHSGAGDRCPTCAGSGGTNPRVIAAGGG